MIRGGVPLAAGSAATRFSNRSASYVPRSSGNTPFFHSSQAGGVRGQVGGIRSGAQGGTMARPNSGANSAGWRRFGAPGGQSNAGSQNTRSSTSSSGGWQRFGEPNSGYRNSQYSGSSPRYNAPANNAPSQSRYNAPSQPRYNAPSSNAPRSGAGGGGSRPASSGGGGSQSHR